MGKRAVLSISEKQELCAYSDQFPLASQQNITNRFSLWDNQSTLYWIPETQMENLRECSPRPLLDFFEIFRIKFLNNTLTRM